MRVNQGHLDPPGGDFCCHVCPGIGSRQLALATRSSLPSPCAPGLGVKTWAPGASQCLPCVILGASAGLPMRQVPRGGQATFQHVPRPTCLLHVCLPPTPSPDGLCQASSAASLTPQQLLGQGHAGTQLAGVPPSLGAAGMLGGTRGGGGGSSFHGDLVPLFIHM